MTLRRDFLAFTAGAVVARTVLPSAARAAPLTAREELEQMAEWDPPTASMLKVWDAAGSHERACIVLMLERVYHGMGMVEAGEMFRLDLADPSRLAVR